MPLAPVAAVLIDGSSEDLHFSYLIPDALADTVLPGCRVSVPLRNRMASGTVLSISEIDPAESKFALKPVSSLLDPNPILTEPLMKLAHWLAEYYMSPVESVFRAMIPQAVRSASPADKTRKVVRLLDSKIDAEARESLQKRAKKQAEVLDILEASDDKALPLQELIGEHRIGRPSITALEKLGWVEVTEEKVARDPFADREFVATSPLNLNSEQAGALESIMALIESDSDSPPRPILLHGVTGSGKTEVYLQAIQEVLDRGKGAIVLVPEISLTPQTADRFKQRFAHMQDQVAVLHSSLSQGERHDEWKKVLNRQAKIVIGARSAVFAPIENLGLIVVDEEHENSYKQETVPRYQARDLAV
ncbi:MAG: primosomal protein N', partial [Verrucomicrobiales bacterium]|nr:primosomal protein N' [Verrucomicrobiales bacterium]